jgi:anti-sigma factor RsiW
MMCSPFELKDYFFGELTAEQRDETERHVDACGVCREELAALSATRSAVLCMREEELPRRIAFVSDKVFEPRGWQKFLASGPQLGFASAAMLAVAIVFHAIHAPAPVQSAPAVAQVERKVDEAEIARRVQAAVEKVVLENQGRETDRLLEMVNSRLSETERQHNIDLKTIAHYLEVTQKRSALGVREAMYQPAGDIQ